MLAISTSSPALSVALLAGESVLAGQHLLIGRGHAEALVPVIADVLAGRRPQAIVVDVGPGSYTGIRIGLAAARALGLAWGVPVWGMSALALVAAEAFAGDAGLEAVAALIDAGRGKVAGAVIGRDLVTPDAGMVADAPDGVALAGAGAQLLTASAGRIVHTHHPDARFAGRLPKANFGMPQALYVTD